MKYRIIEIYDEEYGCEGIPENGEPECCLILEDENGGRKTTKLTARYITENCITEGGFIEL